MSDKVIVSKQDANDLPYVEQEHSGDKYVLLEDIKHWLEDATPVQDKSAYEYIGTVNGIGQVVITLEQDGKVKVGEKLYRLTEAIKVE